MDRFHVRARAVSTCVRLRVPGAGRDKDAGIYRFRTAPHRRADARGLVRPWVLHPPGPLESRHPRAPLAPNSDTPGHKNANSKCYRRNWSTARTCTDRALQWPRSAVRVAWIRAQAGRRRAPTDAAAGPFPGLPPRTLKTALATPQAHRQIARSCGSHACSLLLQCQQLTAASERVTRCCQARTAPRTCRSWGWWSTPAPLEQGALAIARH